MILTLYEKNQERHYVSRKCVDLPAPLENCLTAWTGWKDRRSRATSEAVTI